jgi:hypothetical protein
MGRDKQGMTYILNSHLVVVCNSCDEECNGHALADVRWSRVEDLSSAKPVPVCQICWEESDYTPCDWNELDEVTLQQILIPS